MATRRSRPRRAEPEVVGDALAALAARRGWSDRLEGAKVHLVWTEIVGEELARHVEVVRLHGGVLVVRCSSGAWATQVRWMARDVVNRANAVLGDGRVETVQVTTGHSAHDEGPPQRG